MKLLSILPLLFSLNFSCGDNASYASDGGHDADSENLQESSMQDTDGAEHANEYQADSLAIKINLNTGSREDFAVIPGMNNKMQHEFDEYRPYSSIGQFRKEMGKYVDAEVIEGYEEYIYVPINRNESDAETVMQIPGIDQAIAASIIAARPFDSNANFLSKITELAPNLKSDQISYFLTL